MAVNYSSVAEKIFRVLKGSGYDLKMYDNNEGSEVADPQQARFFYVQDPNLMVNLDDKNAEIKMHKGPTNIVQVQKTLDLLKNLSKTNLLDFDLREFGKEIKPKNYSFRLNTNTMSDNIQTEGLSAPIGTPKTSSQHLEGAKLLIKHRKPVNEEIPGSRSRNIKALYVENADGERFKYPFIHLNGARAMTRHVQAGGTPYDEVGQSITGMSEQLSKIREVLNVMRRSPAVQEQAGAVMNSLLARQDRLRETVKRLTTAEGYKTYAESYTVPVKREYDQSVLNSMKEKFTVTNVDNRIEELLPFITEVNDEENTLEKLRDVVKNKMGSAEFHEPTEKDVDTMPVQFTNDTMRVAARLALVAKLAKDDEVSSYLSRMAAKIRGEDKEPAGGSDAVDKRPYTKDDIQVILKMLDDAKVKGIIQQVEAGKMKMMNNPGDDAYDKAVAGESVLPEIKQIDESFDRMLGMFSPTHIHVAEENDPETDFTKWLKMNYNKTPRDLSADEYAKMSKEFKEQNKKTESSVEEGAVKRAMETDAENMSKEEFMKKHGGPNADDEQASDFYDGYQGVEETDVNEKDTDNDGDKDFADIMVARMVASGMSKEEAIKKVKDKKYNEADASDMFKKGGKFSQTAQNKPVMFKGKQIDLDSVEYDMQDYSDMIFEPEEVKYMDGTDVADEDMEDLMYNDDFVEWVRIDYMDRMQDQADMMRDSTELDTMKKNAGIQTEGGNAFDIAMGDAENIISQASGDKEAMDDLQRLHDEEDDSYAQSTIKDYMSRLEKEGLFRMQRDLAMQENKTPGHGHYDKEKAKELAKKDGKNPERLSHGELMDYIKKAQQMDPAHNQESVDPVLLRIKDLAGI